MTAENSIEAQVASVLCALPMRPALLEVLGDLTRIAAAAQLVHPLRRICAGHPSPAVRFTAERLLKVLPEPPPPLELGNPPDPARVEAALAAPDAESRLAGVGACQGLQSELANPMLRRLINRPESDPWVLAAAIAALGLVGGEEAAEEAAGLIGHPVPRVAANALSALNQREHQTAVLAARARLASEDPRMRAHAVVAMFSESQPEAWAQVEAMAASEHLWMRATACNLATALPHPGSEAVLLGLVAKDDDPEILIKAADALGRRGGLASLGALAQLATEASLPAPIAKKALDALQTRLAVSSEAVVEAAAAWRQARGGSPAAELLPPKRPAPDGDPSSSRGEPPRKPVEPVRVSQSPSEILHRSQIDTLLKPAGGAAPQGVDPRKLDSSSPSLAMGRAQSSALRLEAGVGTVAPPNPESYWSSSRLRRLAFGTVGAMALVAGLTWMVSTTRPGPRHETPPELPTPAPAMNSPIMSPLRTSADGSLDLNSQPATGTRAIWIGTVREASPHRVLLDVEGGARLALLFAEALAPLPAPGASVGIEGIVFRKGRAGITLVAGSQIRAAPVEPTGP